LVEEEEEEETAEEVAAAAAEEVEVEVEAGEARDVVCAGGEVVVFVVDADATMSNTEKG